MIDDVSGLMHRIADLDARLRTIEGGQRAGLSSARLDSGTAGYTISSFGADNWQDDAGVTTPEITMETGSRVLIFAAYRPQNVGSPGASIGVNDFRSIQVVMGIQIDSTEPQNFPLPPMRSNMFINGNGAGGFIVMPLTVTAFREDLVPGEHTFTLRWFAMDSYPAGTVNPLITDAYLCVVPLGPA